MVERLDNVEKGKVVEYLKENEKKILGLNETRWKGAGDFESDGMRIIFLLWYLTIEKTDRMQLKRMTWGRKRTHCNRTKLKRPEGK